MNRVIETDAKSLETKVFLSDVIYIKNIVYISHFEWFSDTTHTLKAKSVGCLLNMKLHIQKYSTLQTTWKKSYKLLVETSLWKDGVCLSASGDDNRDENSPSMLHVFLGIYGKLGPSPLFCPSSVSSWASSCSLPGTQWEVRIRIFQKEGSCSCFNYFPLCAFWRINCCIRGEHQRAAYGRVKGWR